MLKRRAGGTGADMPQQPQSAGHRPRELEDALNRLLYHPLAARLARRLTTTPVTPNMVSVLGGLCVVGAAIAYTQLAWPLSALLGLFLHMTWHVVDGADGDLARMTGRSSATGELIDGICDYVSHIVLYLALGAVLYARIGPWAWALVVASGVSRIAQANHFEVQRRQYQWWVHGVPWLRSAGDDGLEGSKIFAAVRSIYLGLASRLAPDVGPIDAAVAEAEGDRKRRDAIRAVVRREYAALLPRLGMLSANYRTIVLGLSMLAGSPIYYFLYETLLLNIVLLRSIGRGKRAARRIDAALRQPEPSSLR